MILTALGPLTADRMQLPRWATVPASGAGAAAHGGRANRPGTPALYLALYLTLQPETAAREDRQLSLLAAGGTNLVLCNDLLTADDLLEPYHPAGALPKNQDSWR